MTASVFPASIVARYLLSLKHTSIALISPFHQAPWSKIRFKGCASFYRHAGFPEHVKLFALFQYFYQWDYLRSTESRENRQSFISQYTMMLRYKLDPFTKRIAQGGKFVAVDGTIVVRRSTTLARKT